MSCFEKKTDAPCTAFLRHIVHLYNKEPKSLYLNLLKQAAKTVRIFASDYDAKLTMMPPTSKKLTGHIGFELSVRS